MKLFQIEEPDGSPVPGDAPGAAVGIDLENAGIGRVAIAIGGNAEILPDADGSKSLLVMLAREPDATRRARELLLGLRSRAEKQLARPVTHAVIAADGETRQAARAAAEGAGLAVLAFVARASAAQRATGADPADAAALGAALAAEDLAPPAA